MKKIKEIKIVNQDQSTEVANIGADAINVDYNDTTVKDELDKLNAADISLINTQTNHSNTLANLQSEISSLASGSPKGSYIDVNALVSANPDTGVYVIQSNGHVYSWTKNASSAIDLGVYQAISINTDDNLIKKDEAADAYSTGIKTRKIDLLSKKIIYNLFDGNYVSLSVLTTGIVSDSENGRSAIIKIKPNTTYYIGKYDVSDRWRIGFSSNYPKSGDSLRIVASSNSSQTEYNVVTSDSTENYLTIYVTASKLNLIRLCVTEVDQLWGYIEYNNFLEEPLDLKRLENISVKDSLAHQSKILFNLFDGNYIKRYGILANAMTEDIYYDFNRSQTATLANEHYRTAIVKVEPNSKYCIKTFGEHDRMRIATSSVYPKQGDLLTIQRGSTSPVDDFKVNTSSEDNYLIVTVSITAQDSCQLCITRDYYPTSYIKDEIYEIHIDENGILDNKTIKFKNINNSFKTPDNINGGSINDTVNLISSEPTVVTDIYENLLQDYSSIISKTLLTTVNNYEINQYDFNFQTIIHNNLLLKKPKIAILAGIHGYEQGSAWTLAQFVNLLVRNTDNEDLNLIKSNFDFSIIPIGNPYGFAHNQRKNANGIDINRNFDVNFVPGGDPSSDYYGGLVAESEEETKALIHFIENNQDALIILDFHNIASGYPLYYTTDQSITLLANTVFSQLTYDWQQKYTGFPTDRILGYVNTTASLGTFAAKARSKGILSFTVETPWVMPIIGAVKYDKNTIMTAMDVIVNTLIAFINNI